MRVQGVHGLLHHGWKTTHSKTEHSMELLLSSRDSGRWHLRHVSRKYCHCEGTYSAHQPILIKQNPVNRRGFYCAAGGSCPNLSVRLHSPRVGHRLASHTTERDTLRRSTPEHFAINCEVSRGK